MRGIVGNVVLNTTTMDKVEEGIKYRDKRQSGRSVLNAETIDKVVDRY